MMKRFSVFLILLFVGFSAYAKPSPSLSLQMQWLEGGVVYDQPIKIQVELMSQVSSDSMHFALILPDGVTVIDGDIVVQGKIEKGLPLRLEFTLIIDKIATGQIEAEASIGHSAQAFFRAGSQLSIGSPVISQKIGSRALLPPAFRYTERDGVKIREYQLP